MKYLGADSRFFLSVNKKQMLRCVSIRIGIARIFSH